MAAEVCSWCGVGIDRDDGFRLAEPVGERKAAFCRLEHVVPWVDPGRARGPRAAAGARTSPTTRLGRCAQCGDALGDTRVLLVRHRGEHRIADAFCGTDHLLQWAKAGGRWRSAS